MTHEEQEREITRLRNQVKDTAKNARLLRQDLAKANAKIDDIDAATQNYPEPCPSETWRAMWKATRAIIEGRTE